MELNSDSMGMQVPTSKQVIYQNAVRAKAAPIEASREIAVPARAFFLMVTVASCIVFNLCLLVSASVVESF